MRHRVPLPPDLGPHFAVRDAAAIGVGRKRYSSRDLARPFAGVRSAIEPATFDDQVAAYLPRLRDGQAFAGRTALRLWGLPTSVRWSPNEPLDVAVHTGTSPPRTIGVRGRRIAPGRADTWRVHGVPTVDPVSALFLCAREFVSMPMIVALDALLTSSDVYPGLRPGRPVATIESTDRRLTRWGRFPGCGRIRDALPLARAGVESPKETETRLLLTSFGLPEPRSSTSSPWADASSPGSTSPTPNAASPSSTRATAIGRTATDGGSTFGVSATSKITAGS